jgi:uncharacterized protein
MKIVLAYSPQAREVHEYELALPEGSTARDAVLASSVLADFPALTLKGLALGLWGRKCRLDQPLKDKDRVEVYRPLRVDPKVARRERFSQQGTRGAGLFANRRAGGKAGY